MSTGRLSSFCSCFLISEGAEITANKIMEKQLFLTDAGEAQVIGKLESLQRIN